MKRAVLPFALFLVPIVLGCGCVESIGTCTPPPAESQAPAETAPTTQSEPAGEREPAETVEAASQADAASAPALAHESR